MYSSPLVVLRVFALMNMAAKVGHFHGSCKADVPPQQAVLDWVRVSLAMFNRQGAEYKQKTPNNHAIFVGLKDFCRFLTKENGDCCNMG